MSFRSVNDLYTTQEANILFPLPATGVLENDKNGSGGPVKVVVTGINGVHGIFALDSNTGFSSFLPDNGFTSKVVR